MIQDKISKRSLATPPSFVRGILKAAESEDIISFAGGLPNPVSFPQEALNESCNRIMKQYGSKVFQYAATAGLPELRKYIAERWGKMYGLDIVADDIIVTTGSQQALDLIGKVFINEGDHIIVEEPSYLGALQAFVQYQPSYLPVTLEEDGVNLASLEEQLKKGDVKFGYLIPNFQNPSGLTYSLEKRREVLKLFRKYDVILIEDDPYGELSFDGKPKGYISTSELEKSILLGTFSKTVTPGMRFGFMVVKDPTLRKYINTAKEAADLHSNIFSQYILYDYLTNNELDEHIVKIRELYKEQCMTMMEAMKKEFPKGVTYTKPTGGMFIWANLPNGISAMKVFEEANKAGVAFVPGNPFYVDMREASSMRLNYTNASTEEIKEGIARLGRILKKFV